MVDYIELDADGKVLKREHKGRGRPRLGYIQITEGSHVGDWLKDGQTTVEKKAEENTEIPIKIKKIQLDEDEDDSVSLGIRKKRDKRISRYKNPVTTVEYIVSCMHPLSVVTKDGVTTIISPVCMRDTSVFELTVNAMWHRIEIDVNNNSITVWSTYLSAACNEDGERDANGKRHILPPAKIIYGAIIVDK